jgi:3-hydroxyacyl-CoA dehydrogenase
MADIKTVAVIGAGVMGASIAAHCANAGTKVLLLDSRRGD